MKLIELNRSLRQLRLGSFIPTIVTTMESLFSSRLLDFISEINAARTSGRRLPILTRARPTRALVQFASRPCI